MTFATGFMNFSFQTVGVVANDNNSGLLGGIMTPPYGYHSPYKTLQESIHKQKTELEKVNSVIKEIERKKALAEKNRRIAGEIKSIKNKKVIQRLIKAEQQLFEEITRLLAVRAGIMQRIREEEALLIVLMMKRRRLRVA